VTAFDPIGALRTLTDRGVSFVVIGGVAGATHGSPSVTQDLDICYERSPENLAHLAEALRSIDASLRGVAEDVPFRLDSQTLATGDHFTLSTDLGDLDLLGVPAGTNGYEDLRATAVDVDIDGSVVSFASLDDLIRPRKELRRLLSVENGAPRHVTSPSSPWR
jgi:hypothetical protein